MKPGIDNKPPISAELRHLQSNPKKDQIREDNFTEIDRANKVLLQRMTEIIRKPSIVASSMKTDPDNKSLNRDSRRKELKRITNENLAILKRIQNIQPAYDHVGLEQDYKKTREYLKNTCELPFVLGPPSRPPSTVLPVPAIADDGAHPPNSVAKISDHAIESDNVVNQPHFRYVAKDGKRFGDTFYLIEISTDGEVLVISAFSGQHLNGDLELRYDGPAHRELLKSANGDYYKLIDRIRIRDGRICLLPTY